MNTYDLILSRRSIRQFKQRPISCNILEKIMNAGRLAPSAANLQPLEFIAIEKKEICMKIFPCLKWAAYIAPKGKPRPGQEPTAYIVVLVNTSIREEGFERDVGAAVENMILAGLEEGVGSCWLISIDRKKVAKILHIPKDYIVDSIVALGYAAEKPVLEDLKDSIKYWKDGQGVLHVPKRKLKDITHFNAF